MAKELDRTRPYGTVHTADAGDGRAFEQDNTYFGSDGKQWVPPPTADELAAAEKAKFDAAVEARAKELLAQAEADSKGNGGKGK